MTTDQEAALRALALFRACLDEDHEAGRVLVGSASPRGQRPVPNSVAPRTYDEQISQIHAEMFLEVADLLVGMTDVAHRLVTAMAIEQVNHARNDHDASTDEFRDAMDAILSDLAAHMVAETA